LFPEAAAARIARFSSSASLSSSSRGFSCTKNGRQASGEQNGRKERSPPPLPASRHGWRTGPWHKNRSGTGTPTPTTIQPARLVQQIRTGKQ
jgi:hypothetical protein